MILRLCSIIDWKEYKRTRVWWKDRNNWTLKIKTNHEEKLFKVPCSSNRQVKNHQRLIGFDQVHKDGYQRFQMESTKIHVSTS